MYFYFLCRGRQDRTCDLAHLPVNDVENAVLSHYATVGLPTHVGDEVRTMIHRVRKDQYDASAHLRERLRAEIARLDKQEDAYLELVGDPEWTKEKLSARMRTIHDDRERLRRQLTQPEQSEVNAGSEAIDILLTLLDQPQDLYRHASKRARKILNQTFFTRLYVDAASDTTQIVADQHTDTVAQLRALCHPNDQTPVRPAQDRPL